VAHATFPVGLDVDDTWVRPGDIIVAHAHVPAGARVTWLLATRNPFPESWPHLPLAPAIVAPAATQAVARLTDPGRYELAAGGATFNVTVDALLPRGTQALVDLVRSPEGLRAVPDETVAGVGGLLLVTNHDASPARLAERDWLGLLPASGPEARITMPDHIEQGDYELRALATDARGGMGSADAHILYDARKPDRDATYGPFNGTLRPGAAVADPSFVARFPLRTLDVWFNATPKLAGPSDVVVELLGRDGAVIDASAPGPSGHLALRDLPPNEYTMRIRVAQGALVDYSIVARASLVLTTPQSFFDR
jgi:hypothetical protein